MKKLILLILAFAFSFATFGQNVTYVNASATGSNDGSSWENAYTSLVDAIASGPEEVWVAAGTYTPGVDTFDFFRIESNMDLYGGFAGTESAPSQRDIVNNRTILSGDLNGDDISGDVFANRQDNTVHVIGIGPNLSSGVTIDGFDIKGGSTNLEADGAPETQWRGGGIFTYSTIDVRNCRFYENIARSGGGIYVSPAQGIVTNCQFNNNEFYNNAAASQGAGIFLNDADNAILVDCSFTDNSTVRGAFYPLRCNAIELVNCVFERNRNTTNDVSGGAIFNFGSTNLYFDKCEFKENYASNGGAIASFSDTIPDGTKFMTFKTCTFEENEAFDFGGGAIYNWQGTMELDNCDFIRNLGPNGSQFFSNAVAETVDVTNCTFEGGRAEFGGAHTCYGENGVYTLNNNTYKEAIVQTSGGGIIIGFKSIVNVTDCTFENNEANFGGGVYIQNDTTVANFDNCLFKNNTALMNVGGGINAAAGTTVKINNSEFNGNLADFGGAISSTNNRVPLELTNTKFIQNTAFTQGAGANFFSNSAKIESCLFAGNTNNGNSGGAISNNTGTSTPSELTIINSSFYDNSAPLGGSISQFSGDTGAVATLILLNNAFQSEDINYEVESGQAMVISNGGNASSDDSFQDWLVNTKDQNNIESDFYADPDEENFLPANGGPLINKGIDAGAPSTDILGNARFGTTDIGAYELQMVNTIDILDNSAQLLKTAPNPTAATTTIDLTNEWRGSMKVDIYDAVGRLIQSTKSYKLQESFRQAYDATPLQNGIYKIHVTHQNQKLITSFIKI